MRNVYLKDPGPAPIDSWMGQSVAKWEGDTLVIDATGFNDSTWFDRVGQLPQRRAAGHRALHADLGRTSSTTRRRSTDPQTFTRPWKISLPLYRRLEKNAQLMDFKCVEFVEELLYGQYRKKPLHASEKLEVTKLELEVDDSDSATAAAIAVRWRASLIVGARRRPGRGETAAPAAKRADSADCPTAIPICRGCTTSRR